MVIEGTLIRLRSLAHTHKDSTTTSHRNRCELHSPAGEKHG